MWSIYSKSYLKKNQTSSLFLFITLFLSSFFLSFLTALFYNLWEDERIRSAAEGRIWQPTLLTGVYGVLLCLICGALLILIYHAFEMTKEGRLHQLGILQSIGATPGQIYTALMQEAFILAVGSFLPAILLGILLTFGITKGLAAWSRRMQMEVIVRFVYSPRLLLFTAGICLLTVWIAAHRAARRLSRIGVLEAIRGEERQSVPKVRRHGHLRSLTSVEWELASRSLYVRRKAFSTAFFSITLSFLALSLFLNLWAISGASTQQTYFERYQDIWDLMLKIEGQTIDPLLLERLRSLDGVEDCTGFFLDKQAEQTILVLDEAGYQAWIEEGEDTLPRLRVLYEDLPQLQVMSVKQKTEGDNRWEICYQLRTESEEEIAKVEAEVQTLLGAYLEDTSYVLENRLTEWEKEQQMRRGYEWFMEGLCGLFASIGIANIFANTIGSIRLRQKEFARYQSIGFTPDSLKKILTWEALLLVLRPILFCVPPNILFVVWALSISPPTFWDYLRVMPMIPLALFVGALLAFTALACSLAGRRILQADIVESLRDDTLY